MKVRDEKWPWQEEIRTVLPGGTSFPIDRTAIAAALNAARIQINVFALARHDPTRSLVLRMHWSGDGSVGGVGVERHRLVMWLYAVTNADRFDVARQLIEGGMLADVCSWAATTRSTLPRLPAGLYVMWNGRELTNTGQRTTPH